AQYTDPDGGTSVLIPIICRFNTDGSPDTSFNSKAFIALTAPTFANSYFTDLQLESSGKLLFFGSRKSDFFIVRVLPDGTVDNTFADNGKAVTDINSSYDLAHGFIIQPDEKMVCVGQTLVDNILKPIILRYKPDGTLDSTFGTSTGYTIIQEIANFGNFIDVVQQPADGKFIAAGYYMDPVTDLNWFYLARFNNDGSVDSTFDSDGIVTLDFGTGTNQFLTKIALQTDGKIIAVGKVYTLSSSACVARFNPDGSLDATFQGGGKQMLPWGITSSSATSCLIQPDDKIVLTGYASNVSSDESFIMMRMLSSGAPDNTFGSNGIAENNFGSNAAIATCSTIQSDGKLIAGGYNGQDAMIARYSGLFIGIGSVKSPGFSFQLFPNPASTFTSVICDIEQPANVSISLCNALGVTVAPLYNGFLPKGKQNLAISIPANIADGIYYCRIQSASSQAMLPFEILK
ncbi:MAG: T9SS type A sorting domain-containing protein, partial [Chitinophagales bacterium]